MRTVGWYVFAGFCVLSSWQVMRAQSIRQTPAPDPPKSHSETVEELIMETWRDRGPAEMATALAVSRAENQPRECAARSPRNENRTHDWGIFQINDIHVERFTRMGLDVRRNCEDNIRAARILYEERAWRPWYTWRDGKHRPFLARYQEIVQGWVTQTQTARLPDDAAGSIPAASLARLRTQVAALAAQGIRVSREIVREVIVNTSAD